MVVKSSYCEHLNTYKKTEAEYLMKHISECPSQYFRRHKRRDGPEKQYAHKKKQTKKKKPFPHSAKKGAKEGLCRGEKNVT